MQLMRARVLAPIAPDEVAWWPDAAVAIDGGRIVSVVPWASGVADVDLRPGVLVPGFVDAHVHYPQTRIVGSASGPLLQWLEHSTFPEEARFSDVNHATAVAEIFATKLCAAGTTSAFVYGSVHASAARSLFECFLSRGLQVRGGPVLMDAHSPPELMVPVSEAMAGLTRLMGEFHGAGEGRIELAVLPRFALSCTAKMMAAGAEFANAHGLWVSTHLSENTDECRIATERFGTEDYLAVYEDAGLVHDRSVFAHCIHLSKREWERLAAAGAVVAHCPDSNDFLGSGGMPLSPIDRLGIDVVIGTDVAAGRSFRVPRILSAAYDNGLRQGVTIDPRRLLWWGTRGGALALGWADRGAFKPGLWADMALMDVPEWADTEDKVLASVLFDHDAGRALKTWVRGRVVWERDTLRP
jgi:guanine deaminase